MYQFLSSYQLTRDIGSKYEYSNLKRRTGVVVLSNTSAAALGVDDYRAAPDGRRRAFGTECQKQHTEITVNPKVLTDLWGRINWRLPSRLRSRWRMGS